ncbi:hypothetical protein V8E36_004395 [Tilletia maclaganii]
MLHSAPTRMPAGSSAAPHSHSLRARNLNSTPSRLTQTDDFQQQEQLQRSQDRRASPSSSLRAPLALLLVSIMVRAQCVRARRLGHAGSELNTSLSLPSSAQALSDRLVGGAMLFVAAFVFAYYSLWALITPFFPADAAIQSYFPDRVWAVRGPALLLIVGLGGVGAFVGMVMQREAAKRREREMQRRA